MHSAQGLRQVATLPLLLVAGGLGGLARLWVEPPFAETLQLAIQSVAAGRPNAESQCRRLLRRDPHCAEASWLLGSLLAARNDSASALACFARIPSDHPEWPKARLALGSQWTELGDVVEAENILTPLIDHPVVGAAANRYLLALYGCQLRRDEWSACLWRIIDADDADLRAVIQLVILEHLVWQGEGIVETLQKYVAANPDDQRSRASLVQHLVATGRSDEAREHLDRLSAESSPSPKAALAVMAYAVSEASPRLVDEFINKVPRNARQVFETLPAWKRGLGQLALLQGDAGKALPLLTDAAIAAPFHPAGRQQLALAVRLLGRSDEAGLHAEAANVLARLDRTCHSMQTNGSGSVDDVLVVVKDAASVGMVREAKAWIRFALKRHPDDQRLHQWFQRLEREPATSRSAPPDRFLDPRKAAARW
jgi:tetratricopeptide (TPR) repeat protein